MVYDWRNLVAKIAARVIRTDLIHTSGGWLRMQTSRLLLITSMLAATPAFANDANLYAGADFFAANYEDPGVSSVHPEFGLFKFGAIANDYLSFETRVGFSGLSDSNFDGTRDVEVDIKKLYGLYTKFTYPLGDTHPYFVLGYTHGELQAKLTDSTGKFTRANETGTDESYGLGIDYIAGAAIATLEYTKYYDKHDVKLSGISIGLAFKF